MKTLQSTLKACFALLLFSTVVVSCSKDNETTEVEDSNLDITEIEASAEVDAIEGALEDLVIEVYENQEASETGRVVQPPQLPDCVTITIIAQQNFREVTIDFGSEGCMVRGHELMGKIILSWTRDPEAQQRVITYELEDFFIDAKAVIGSRTILKELSNDNGNPQFTHTVDLTVIWPNGLQASREGTKIREWIEGFGSGVFSDNVFEVSGNWTTTFVNGNTHTYEVMQPLRREVICTYFVSGTVDVQRTNFGGTLDFGEGDCDNKATFTFNNGNEIEITLN
ncbi:hypothetical protein [Winogradskyella sp. A3E31]|uniref:hypothetical protein n=1 Tax=Winogradskyella sp. A3E31 TaxID=3349637 RepID=UPI00398B82B2